MNYMLDVNALVALAFINHQFHGRLASWVQSQDSPNLVSCSITELGFVRVLAQAPAYGFSVTQARTLLLRLRKPAPLLLRSFQMNTMFPSCLLGLERLSKLPTAT